MAFDNPLLPDRQVNWGSFAASYSLQLVLLAFLLGIGLIHPEPMVITTPSLLYTPLVTETSTPYRVESFSPHRLPAPPSAARLIIPREALRSLPHKAVAVEPPKVVFASVTRAPALVKADGAMPRPIVHTVEFSGSSANAPVVHSIEKIQTGSFNDPEGTRAQSNTQSRLMMARMGSFDMAAGPGNGNGAGGANGTRGIVASAGFSGGTASPGQGDGRTSGDGSVQTGGFGDATVAAPVPARQQVIKPATTPVEILSKPKPIYTDEARQLGLQGEVLVAVLFGANGQTQVLQVVKGLGHGLDQAAIIAASQIRFKPAIQDGRPVDSSAVVDVIFEMAN